MEHRNFENPAAEYIKHMSGRYAGEVALAWSNFTWYDGPPPRKKLLWHPQFAQKPRQRSVLTGMARRDRPKYLALFWRMCWPLATPRS